MVQDKHMPSARILVDTEKVSYGEHESAIGDATLEMKDDKLHLNTSKTLVMVWKSFVSNTTVHGFQYLVGFRQHKIRG